MKLKEYKKALAAVLSVGMLTVQTAPVLAADMSAGNMQAEQSSQIEPQQEVRQAMAVDGSGMVDISEKVLLMLEEESVYQDEETGYLYDRETGQKVDPVSGERAEETVPDVKPDDKPNPDNKPNPNPDNKPNPNPDNRPDQNTDNKPDLNPDGKPNPDDKPNSNPDSKPNPNPDGKPNPNPDDTAGGSNTETSGDGTSQTPGADTGKDNETQEDIKDSEQGKENGSDTDENQVTEKTQNSTDSEQKDKKADAAKEDAEEAREPSTNQALIARQQIIKLPEIEKDFRFWTVARSYAFAKAELSVREEMTDTARAVGSLKKDGLLYVLQEEENGWLYVESGTVRGFVKAEEVLRGDEAKDILKSFKEKAKKKAEKEKKQYSGIESVASLAKELVPKDENNAYFHTHSTVNRTVVDKKYALSTVGFLNVREDKGITSRSVGTLKANSLCYILADANEEWVYIESGDVRGFVDKKYLKTGKEVDKTVKETGEENFPLASEIIEPENNKACYYTLTSIKSGIPGGQVRNSLLEFAAQFIGNPYVWGGTSLTEGADCSGFVQSVYKQYGYDLPRVAEAQAQYGTKIAVEDAQPGDLIFYAKNGYIHHVVIYAGEGKTIEAMGSDYGIVQGSVDTSEAVWASKVLDDTSYDGYAGSIGEVNADDDMYGDYLGNFQLTYYCSCEVCCDVETGITATGTPVLEGQTIAVDPKVIPYGTQVIIGGHVFTAEDCGGAVKDKHIDIYVNDHDRALAMGVSQADVFLVK